MAPRLAFPLVASSRLSFTVAATILMMVAAVHTAQCQNVDGFRVGLVAQKNAVLQPGLELGYADANRLGRHLRFSLTYLTSRASVTQGGGRLMEDRVLLGSGWHLRPHRPVDPFVELEVGYTRFDREDGDLFERLDNGTAIASVLFGLEVRLVQSRFSVRGDIGYSVLQSSTVYPFAASAAVLYSLQTR